MEDNLNKIHETALKILQDIGINLLHPEILDIAQQKGVRVSGQRAFFEPEQVMHWVRKAPHTFTLYARNPNYNSVFGGDNIQCSPGYGSAQIIMADGRRRDAQLRDYIAFTKLTHQCEYFNLNGGILAQPCDVQPDKSHLIMLYAAILHSDKCLIGMPGAGEKMQEIMDMLDSYQKPELDADVQKQLEQYLVQAGVAHKIIDAIKNRERRGNNDLWQSRYGN